MRRFAFSANGRWLCAWAISPKEDSDGAFFWDVSQSTSTTTCSERFYKIDTSPTTDYSLWPYPNSAACVVQEEGYGLTFVAQGIESVLQTHRSREDSKIAGVLSACVTTHNTLICVIRIYGFGGRRRMNRLVEFRLRTDARPYDRIAHSMRELGSLGNAYDRTAIATTVLNQAHIKVVYYCWTDRHVEATSYSVPIQS